MANDRPGLEVCKHLVASGDRIVRLYLHPPDKQTFGREIAEASGCASQDIYLAPLLKDPEHIEGLKNLGANWIITVYWAYLLSTDVIGAAKDTVNFHPALLPVNRGWYPHVHSIIDGTPTGVTLHAIDAGADTGPIWVQKKVALTPYDTAYTIYNLLQTEIVNLFKESWPKISGGQIEPFPQDESKANFHRKDEVKDLDRLDPEATMKVKDLINLLRARSFGHLGFAYYEVDGKPVYLNLQLNETPTFEGARNPT